MEKRRSIYLVELTYRPRLKDVDAGEYKDTFGESTEGEKAMIRKRFLVMAQKHVKALHQSVRDHAKTQGGKDWSGELHSVISCYEGFCLQEALDATQDYPRIARMEEYLYLKREGQPERLHIHLLVDGKPGRTIVEWICNYWQRKKKFGWAKKKMGDETDLHSWYNEYTAVQQLGASYARFGEK